MAGGMMGGIDASAFLGGGTAPRGSARRRLVVALVAVVLLGIGVAVLIDSAQLSSALFGSPASGPSPANPFGSAGYLSFAVYGFGIALIGAGGMTLRRVYHTSVDSYMSGGKGAAPQAPTDPQLMMQQAMSQIAMMQTRAGAPAAAPGPPPPPDVKVKCRNCGALEDEDAKFCRKCGQPL